MGFRDDEQLPGQVTSISLKADPGSLCAYSVVDKSVLLLGGNGQQLQTSQVFTRLRQYELSRQRTPYQRNTYCDQIRGNPPSRYHRYSHTQVVDNYIDSSKAFQNVGLLVMSNLDIQSRPCWKKKVYRPTYYYISGGLPHPDGWPGAPPRRVECSDGYSGPLCQSIPQGFPGPVAARTASVTVRTMTTPRTTIPTPPPVVNLPSVGKPVVELRSYFPETWLWDMKHMGNSSRITWSETLPHTITEWIGNAFCTNSQSGLGISPTANIRAFQSFFLSFTLPYSVVRGERVHLPVTVFNYLPACLVIKVDLEGSSQYNVVNDRTTHLCVCSSESKTNIYEIVFSEIGKVNISVKGESVVKSGICDNNQVTIGKSEARDAVTRQLLVEPEGKEEEYSYNYFICVEDGSEEVETAELTLPDDLVDDSARAEVTVIGDVMGSTLSGLGKLLRLPTGCGEQNMVKFAPNIYILDYLTSTNQLTVELKQEALGYLKTGYQREQIYKHTDGSYSAFGERDGEGSTWLTAFVVKCFAQATRHIFIEQKHLQQSINWFRKSQDTNGCFLKKGRMLNRGMKGGLSSGSSSVVTLTTYVLISLLEANISKTDNLVTNAIRCLDGYSGNDTYTVATMSYAYTLWNRRSTERANSMTKLNNLAIIKDGMTHWSRESSQVVRPIPPAYWRWRHRAASADVEMTAYALLAHTVGAGKDGVGTGAPIVKWLTKQRNPYGGFSSTQDTVVALQSLAKFAELAHKDRTDLTVEVTAGNIKWTANITNANALLLQPQEIPIPNNLNLRVRGEGCALVQANVRYNINDMDSKVKAFQLNSSTWMNDKNCNIAYIRICVRYTGLGKGSDMTVVSVKMVSGWEPAKDSLKELLDDTELDLKKFDIELNVLNFYFDELTSEAKCFQLRVTKYMEVTDTKPGMIEVYDYYDTDLSATIPYNIREC